MRVPARQPLCPANGQSDMAAGGMVAAQPTPIGTVTLLLFETAPNTPPG